VNFSELKDELFARGTDYLEEDAQGVARAERWLNQGYREIVNLQAWSFLRTTVTANPGDGFVSIPDLRRVLYVSDATGVSGSGHGTSLRRVSIEDLVEGDFDLSKAATPEVYYTLGPAVYTYPLGGLPRVTYLKRVPPMSGVDEPIFDEEYHNLIVDKAMVKAYIDSDNFEAAAALRAEIDAGLAAMGEDYMIDAREVQFMEPTGTDM
jgi:hypothetical protein